MKLKVEHLTLFEYDSPVYETATEVRLQPITNPDGPQRCESFVLEVEPATQIYEYADYFGNRVHHFSVLQRHTRLAITASAVVYTGPGPTPATPQELVSIYEYVAASRFAEFSPPAIGYAARFDPELAATDPAGLAEEVCRTINREFQYKKGVTSVDSTVAQVLELKSGVCQDFAHLMITIARCLGLPARYVSGYLYAGRSSEDQDERAGASHAWCEVYTGPERGWVAYDPTHRHLLTDERYIKIGTGRDYADVTPVRGTYKGKSTETLTVNVRVSALD